MRLSLLLALAFVAASCSSVESSAGGSRVLFLGNSLTYTHDLPRAVAALAEAAGEEMAVASVTAPNVSLEDLWHDGRALDAIASGAWDVVVMQQGPSTQPASREHLAVWVGRFAERARAEGVRPAVYMVWPPAGTDLALAEASYADAAEGAGALLLPVGRAWRLALEADPDMPLYGLDGFHPSPTGTALAALVIYGGVAGELPDALPSRLPVGATSVELDAALVEAASRALGASGR